MGFELAVMWSVMMQNKAAVGSPHQERRQAWLPLELVSPCIAWVYPGSKVSVSCQLRARSFPLLLERKYIWGDVLNSLFEIMQKSIKMFINLLDSQWPSSLLLKLVSHYHLEMRALIADNILLTVLTELFSALGFFPFGVGFSLKNTNEITSDQTALKEYEAQSFLVTKSCFSNTKHLEPVHWMVCEIGKLKTRTGISVSRAKYPM